MAIHRTTEMFSTSVTEETLQKFARLAIPKYSREISSKHVLQLAELITRNCKENKPTTVSVVVVMVGESLTSYLLDGRHAIKALEILYRELDVDLRHVTILYTVCFADSEKDILGHQF